MAPHNRSHTVVPCNGCTLCCQGDAIRILPEDDAELYLTEPHPVLRGVRMIAHRPDGNCIYLDDHGCTIHDRAPSLCRTADCRVIARRISFEEARQLHMVGRLDLRVWDKGKELLGR